MLDEYDDDVYYCFVCHRAMDKYEVRRFVAVYTNEDSSGQHQPICDACYWSDYAEDE